MSVGCLAMVATEQVLESPWAKGISGEEDWVMNLRVHRDC